MKQLSRKLEESLQKTGEKSLIENALLEKSIQTPLKETPAKETPAKDPLNQSSAHKQMINSNLRNQNGLISRAIKDIFMQVGASEQNHYEISCSFFEIYNDIVFD